MFQTVKFTNKIKSSNVGKQLIVSLLLRIRLTLDLAKCSCLNIRLTLHTIHDCMSVYTAYKLLIS